MKFRISQKQIDKLKQYLDAKDTKSGNARAQRNSKRTPANK